MSSARNESSTRGGAGGGAGQIDDKGACNANDGGDAGPPKNTYLARAQGFVTASNMVMYSTIATLVVLGLAFVIVLIFLGVYSYGNPDTPNAFYIDGLDEVALTEKYILTTAEEQSVTVRPGYPVNMAKLFRTWFMWGFWGCILQLILLTVVVPLYFLCKTNLGVIEVVYGVAQALLCCSNVAWYILGFFWRFSRAGRVAAGEKMVRLASLTDEQWSLQRDSAAEVDGYQLRGGAFMATYLWIVLIVFLLAIVAGSVISIICCCQGDEVKDDAANADDVEKARRGPDAKKPKGGAGDKSTGK